MTTSEQTAAYRPATRAEVIQAQIDEWVAHHPPRSPAVIAAHGKVREATRSYMMALVDAVPDTEERGNALECARMAMFLANTAVALHHPDNLT